MFSNEKAKNELSNLLLTLVVNQLYGGSSSWTTLAQSLAYLVGSTTTSFARQYNTLFESNYGDQVGVNLSAGQITGQWGKIFTFYITVYEGVLPSCHAFNF